jgi:hypothetical protein
VNSHLTEPPPRTFVGPPEVITAVEKLEGVLARAAVEGRGLKVSLTEDGNIYAIS